MPTKKVARKRVAKKTAAKRKITTKAPPKKRREVFTPTAKFFVDDIKTVQIQEGYRIGSKVGRQPRLVVFQEANNTHYYHSFEAVEAIEALKVAGYYTKEQASIVLARFNQMIAEFAKPKRGRK